MPQMRNSGKNALQMVGMIRHQDHEDAIVAKLAGGKFEQREWFEMKFIYLGTHDHIEISRARIARTVVHLPLGNTARRRPFSRVGHVVATGFPINDIASILQIVA